MWATEFEFAQDNFNGGNLAINENKDKALLFYIDREKIEFANIVDENGNVIGRDVKEEWMKNTHQSLNRMTVEVLLGGKEISDKLVFKEQAQTGQWWQTVDLNDPSQNNRQLIPLKII
ncbi:hypothetical protein [Acinetobacter larvae]|uniref:Uncharacterized protein n=1 Tax=Acinetobacter larvae TaxID=1789224 RepID=A0A1B2LZ01_9GAMM|nr:hypothetical protein [Acinetobacter larvae]AOA58170.1 hypothetical protein BFG52_07250 [Acinetobacter larvae]